MNLSKSELETFSDSVSRALAEDVEMGAPGGYRRPTEKVWSALAELGAFAALATEEQGGLGLGWEVMRVILQAFGASLSTQPFLETAILGGGILRHAGNGSVSEMLAGSLNGSVRLAFAYGEVASRYNPEAIETRVSAGPDGITLTGTKTLVLGAAEAHYFLVTARTSGSADSGGIAIFCVPADMEGVSTEACSLIDGRAAGTVVFKKVRLAQSALVAGPDRAGDIIARVLEEAALAASIEAVGAMERLLAGTIEYCRTRTAFGSPVSKFQAVQHKLVDMQVALEYATAVVEAAVSLMDGEAGERARSVSVAKAVVGTESDFLGQAAIQLHGAIGTTEDVDAGRYFKRLLVCRQLFGDVGHHRRQYVSLRHRIALEATA